MDQWDLSDRPEPDLVLDDPAMDANEVAVFTKPLFSIKTAELKVRTATPTDVLKVCFFAFDKPSLVDLDPHLIDSGLGNGAVREAAKHAGG